MYGLVFRALPPFSDEVSQADFVLTVLLTLAAFAGEAPRATPGILPISLQDGDRWLAARQQISCRG